MTSHPKGLHVERVAKRLLDLAITVPLLLLLLPLIVLLAVAIKLDSRDPVLYRCRRVGFQGPFLSCSSSARWSTERPDRP